MGLIESLQYMLFKSRLVHAYMLFFISMKLISMAKLDFLKKNKHGLSMAKLDLKNI